jgi:hypothetical protein
MASNLISAASSIAREQGARRVTREHVSIAIDEWAIPSGLIDYNPLDRGLDGYERRAS